VNKDDVVKATIDIETGGRGVLIQGDYIITAAHCIPPPKHNSDMEKYWMLESDYASLTIITVTARIKVTPYVIERIKDVAILGPMDDQIFPDESDKFTRFCEEVQPVSLWSEDVELFKRFPIYVYNYDKKWVKGEAQQCTEDAPQLAITTNKQVVGGASGGPVVNENGDLVGVISLSSICVGKNDKCVGMIPRPHMTLPVWIIRKIMR